jgi:hypothetical protein
MLHAAGEHVSIILYNRRKRLNFAPSASLWLILPPTQQKRPHTRRKPAMQPHDIKAN